MNRIFKYFNPRFVDSYFDGLRVSFYISLCLIAVLLTTVALGIELLTPNSNFQLSKISKISILILMILNLFVLKYTNIKTAGNIFSFITIFTVLVFMNVLSPNVNALYKYVQSFYTIYVFIVISVMFASYGIILINMLMVLASTLRVYFFALHHFGEFEEFFTAGLINHAIITVAISAVIFYSSRLMQAAVRKASEELRVREQKNQELLSSEEEIRASNEELVATTDALVNANEELRVAKDKAEESDRLKTEFLNNMSHEVRTPMNGIIGFAQLVEMPDIEEGTRKNYIDVIKQSSKQLLSIIDNIIEISKLGTKQVKVFEEEVNLNKLLTELYSVFDIKAEEKGLELFFLPECNDNESDILLDELKLYKILSNLLENAIKFTEVGKIEFGYTVLDSDEHELAYNSKAIQFYVRDTGIGVPQEKQEMIFQKFAQVEEFASRQYGGLGLGLSIAKENTELLEGAVSVDSEEGQGTTFYITIPLRRINNQS